MKIQAAGLIALSLVTVTPLAALDHGQKDAPHEVVIPEGTRVELRLKQTVSSASAEPQQTILFEAADDVVVDGFKVIEKGAEGTGTILQARPRKGFGRQDRYNKAGIVTLFVGPFGIFVKGRDVEVPMGYGLHRLHRRRQNGHAEEGAGLLAKLRGRWLIPVLGLIGLLLPSDTGAVAEPRYAGRPLIEVLQDLQHLGLPLVYSSQVVGPEIRVADEPRSAEPRQILDEILAPHDLEARAAEYNILILR